MIKWSTLLASFHLETDDVADTRVVRLLQEAEDQVQGGLLLDVVVGQGAAVFELLAGKDEALLIRRNAFLVLNLGLDILNGIGRLDVQGDGLAGQGLDEDLHARPAAQTEHQVQGRFLLDVVVGQGASVFELLAGKNQALLIGWDAFLVLNLGLDVLDGIGAFHIQRDGLARQGLDKDLHATHDVVELGRWWRRMIK